MQILQKSPRRQHPRTESIEIRLVARWNFLGLVDMLLEASLRQWVLAEKAKGEEGSPTVNVASRRQRESVV